MAHRLLCLSIVSIVVGSSVPLSPAFAGPAREFSQFPAKVKTEASHAVKFETPEAKKYRSAIAKAAKKPPNFAGYCTLVEVGCGSGCVRFLVVDRKSGEVIDGGAEGYGELAYKPGSRLLEATTSCPDTGKCPKKYFLFESGQLHPLD